MAAALQQLTSPLLLRAAPWLTVGLFLGPVFAGTLGTLLPAFGWLPVLGGDTLSLAPWRALLAEPGLERALLATLVSGFGSTGVAFALTVLVFAAGHGTTAFQLARRAMTPLLAVPHVAIAVGLAFLIAPSGWLARLASPWLTGWARPPDLALVQDPLGLALGLGLVLKELPFLVLMTFAALGQVDPDRRLAMARALGYGPVTAWLKAVFPLVYPQIRLPLFAVLAYALSVVDMALVLGPTTPPTLGPLVLRLFNDPDLQVRFTAAAGAALQVVVVVAGIATWSVLEQTVKHVGRPWLSGGARGGSGQAARGLAGLALGGLFVLALGAVLSLAVWSIAGPWRYPEPWPDAVGLGPWVDHLGALAGPGWNTLGLGLLATGIALALVIACLENEARLGRRPGRRALMLIYLPLLVPQIGFLFGVQTLLVRAALDGTWLALTLAHVLFVLPYVFLALADPYRALDPRYERAALALGKSRLTTWWRVKLALLLRPLLVAAAVGFSVSATQYLPTLFAGGGRFPTLTTEVVSLLAGGDRRIVGVMAFTLGALPLLGFALAVGVPAWRDRNRRGMTIGAAA